MRKAIVILALTVATALASAGDAFAQRRGWRVNLGNGSIRIGDGNPNYRQGYYGQDPYWRYGQYPYGYDSRYYSNPTRYYYSDPIVRDSYYYEPTVVRQPATVLVQVPRADAKVWFDGALTTQQGMERYFYTPPLDPNGNFTYTVRARWQENGKDVERQQQVNVQPGQSATVAFRTGSGENLPAPPTPK